jgi:hypothetical protein
MRQYGLVDSDPQERLRRICLALPETTERLSHGEPAWFVRGKKTFVSYADHHHDDRLAFWCAGQPGAQEALVAESPLAFFVPPLWAAVAGSEPGSTCRSTGRSLLSSSRMPTVPSRRAAWSPGSTVASDSAGAEPPGH